MKECPECELLNMDDADTCKHCGTAFFFTPECLQPTLHDPEDNLVVIGRYADLVEASFVLNLLERHDIAACIPEELTPQILGFFGASPLESVTVRVAARDVEAARKVIAETGSEKT